MTGDPASLLPSRILILDDERQIHASLRLRLGSTHDLEFSFGARDALDKVRDHRFDLCLVDIQMPEMDGLKFIEAAQELDPDLGFVVLSAFDSPENLRRTIPLQVYDFVCKPLPERTEFEGRLPAWIERTRQRRHERLLARQADGIVAERDTARLEREVELVASETARDALQQTAGLLTTIHAHLLSVTAQLAARPRLDPTVTHLLRSLEEARKTSDAAMTVAEGFFDSAYGSRDTSPALPNDGIPHAIAIALRISRADLGNKTVDYRSIPSGFPIRGLSGIEFLLMLLPALAAALISTAPATTVGVRAEYVPRLDYAARDRSFFWLNRKHSLGSHAALTITISAAASPPSTAEVESWLNARHPPLAVASPWGLTRGIRKCRGLFGAAVSPHAGQFGLKLILPT